MNILEAVAELINEELPAYTATTSLLSCVYVGLKSFPNVTVPIQCDGDALFYVTYFPDSVGRRVELARLCDPGWFECLASRLPGIL